MPCYDYLCKNCNQLTEIFHTMSSKKKHYCPDCKSLMIKQIGCGYIAKSMKPSLADQREAEYIKKVKDPERAIRNRKKAFGHDAVGDPCMQTDPRHIVKRGKVLDGQQKDIDKKEFIKAAAKDDRIVAECQKALKRTKK